MITLARHRLEQSRTDAIAYGAKDTGTMGGGAAGAILQAAGPLVLEAMQLGLASSPRQVGTVITTDSFNLKPQGIKWICHIVSIIKHTPQGAWCPHPQRLEEGVVEALTQLLDRGGQSITLSALGTGEGRVPPLDTARYMIGGAQKWLASHYGQPTDIEFALPNYRDFEAFSKYLKSHRP